MSNTSDTEAPQTCCAAAANGTGITVGATTNVPEYMAAEAATFAVQLRESLDRGATAEELAAGFARTIDRMAEQMGADYEAAAAALVARVALLESTLREIYRCQGLKCNNCAALIEKRLR